MYYPIYLLSLLPFGILYMLSDIAYIIMYYVVGYRRDIVHYNLSTSFPEKTKEEIKSIEHKFYHWLCDYFVDDLSWWEQNRLKNTSKQDRTALLCLDTTATGSGYRVLA